MFSHAAFYCIHIVSCCSVWGCSLLETCLSPVASVLAPRACFHLSLWVSGSQDLVSGVMCASVWIPPWIPMGWDQGAPSKHFVRTVWIPQFQVHRELNGWEHLPPPSGSYSLCGVVIPLKHQLWYPSAFLLLPSLSIFLLNSCHSWSDRWT